MSISNNTKNSKTNTSELREREKHILDLVVKTEKAMHIEETLEKIKEIEEKFEKNIDWNNASPQTIAEQSQKMKEKSFLIKNIDSIKAAKQSIKDIKEFIDMSEKEKDAKAAEEIIQEIKTIMERVEKEITRLKIQSIFKEQEDKENCFIEINAGAGGTDSQDLAQKMLRMYTMWADKKGFQARLVDSLDGEESGIKNCTLEIKGYLSFGYLKNENGVHRFVRLSPFNANNKRQTSFVSVFVYPMATESVNINIDEKDLKIQTYRSSGAGGQHVNTTDSAVRITHIPTQITAQCQSQRSQVQNKAEAMSLLKSKIIQRKKQEDMQKKEKIEQQKADISWGNQIRNYVFHPYKLVKDLRSEYSTQEIESVMNGDLEEIINSLLMQD